MSEDALEDFLQARDQQQLRNEARNIRKQIDAAQQDTAGSAFRWPFESLQNAIDAGPRLGRSAVDIVIQHMPGGLRFEHDGAPFTPKDLAALLSGGSNKDFDSEITTRRFGTGFLATHALSSTMSVRGLLNATAGHERFALPIDRTGDEDQILRNTQNCNAAIVAAERVGTIDHLASAEFQYPLTNDALARDGIAAFRDVVPYLYATRATLGRVRIASDDGEEAWTAAPPLSEDYHGGTLRRRLVRRETPEAVDEMWIYWFSADPAASAIVKLAQDGETWTVVRPPAGARRIFRDNPLEASTFLPLPFVLNGTFDPRVERHDFPLSPRNRDLVEKALDAAVLAVTYAIEHGWYDAHLLAAVSAPASGFRADEAERQFWTQALAAYAGRLARLPIVETRNGRLASISVDNSAYADFVVPRVSATSTHDETSHDRMWALVNEAAHLLVPPAELSEAWTAIALDWSTSKCR